MADLTQQKEELIEMYGVHFELQYNLPPLASRILGILIIDSCKKGLTFEELTDRTAASKSSVSTSINLLLKLEKINYYTICGDRKKYFKPSPFSERLKGYLKMIAFEKEILERMLDYRKKTASCPAEQCSLENTKAYKDHVLNIENLLLEAVEKFKKIEQKKVDQYNTHKNH
ncbi:GbsR/MarR family transcriptional regulator [Flavobacterium rhizosphaerae]|uniref:DNA-binding transcriptional regulator GbsR, MarR family n=1 Tax=Flavobacterium rhizosphaerae TaxID=3163298 RepID=A0ABW8YXK1_9FLAO